MDNTFVAISTAFSLICIALISAGKLPPGWLFTLYIADAVVCGSFAWDFATQYSGAERKSSFLKHQGYEVLTAMPVVVFYPVLPFSGIAAIFRLLKLIPLILNPERLEHFKNWRNRFIQKSRLILKLPP